MPSSQQAYQNQFQMQLASQLALALSQHPQQQQHQYQQTQTASAPSQPSLTALVQASQQRSLQPTSQTDLVNAFLQQLNNYQTSMQQPQQYQPQPQEQIQSQLHQRYQQLQQSLQATNLSSPQDNRSQQLQRMMNENMLLTQLLQPSTSVASSNFLSQAVQMQQQHLNQLHHIQRQQAVPSWDVNVMNNLGGQLQDHAASAILSSASASASELASQGHLQVPNPHHSKEKRWMMRYEELRQFQQVSGCCLCIK